MKALNFSNLLLILISGALIFSSCQDSISTSGALENSDNGSLSDSLEPAPDHWYWADPLAIEQSTVTDAEFKVFDGTRLRNKPDMQQYGFTPLEIIYATRLWDVQSLNDIPFDELPDPDLLQKETERAARKNPHLAMLDIEHWPNTGDYYDDVLPTIKKAYRVVDRMQKIKPDLNLGYYEMVPVKNYSHRLTKDVLSKWQKRNDYLRPLADKVNAFFIQSYTYWQDSTKWEENLKNNISEARRLAKSVGDANKPVYVILWPRYYWGFDYDSSLNRTYIDADYWKFQLDTARKYADGVVIWSRAKQDFDSSAPWWDVTKQFIQNLKDG